MSSSSAEATAQAWVQEIRPMWENMQDSLDDMSEGVRAFSDGPVLSELLCWTLVLVAPMLHELVETASEKAGTRRSTVLLGAGVFIVLFLFFNFGEGFIVNMLGFVYPAYASFKAIESDNKDDDRQWLTYWVVAGFALLMETVFGFVLRMIPFYNLVKAAALLYMQLPMFNGAKFIYTNFLRALLQRHEEHIDRHLATIRSSVERVLTPRGTHEMPSFEAVDEWAESAEVDEDAMAGAGPEESEEGGEEDDGATGKKDQ